MSIQFDPNYSVFGDEQRVYISSNDHNLIEITGPSTNLILTILKFIVEEDTTETLFSRIKESFNDDFDLFCETISWMTSNGLLRESDRAVKWETKEIRTYIFDPDSTVERQKKIRDGLTSSLFKFTKSETEVDSDLILVIAPIFENMKRVLTVNRMAYERSIPLCHVSLDASPVFIIGPIVDANQHTPCLNCYLKRKLTNLKNPVKMHSFINYSVHHNPLKQRNGTGGEYNTIVMEYLKIELTKYFMRDRRLSPLLGKAITFDNSQFVIEKSKILKVPGCDVCKPYSNRVGFNI